MSVFRAWFLLILLSLVSQACAYSFPSKGIDPISRLKEQVAQPGDWEPTPLVLRYLEDRLWDFTDIVAANLSFNMPRETSYQVNARVTWLLWLGAEEASLYRVGWSRRSLGYWKETRQSGAFGPIIKENYQRQAKTPFQDSNRFLYRKNTSERGPLEVGLTLHYLLGVEMALRPLEVVDFLAGLFALDPLKDDNSAMIVAGYDPGPDGILEDPMPALPAVVWFCRNQKEKELLKGIQEMDFNDLQECLLNPGLAKNLEPWLDAVCEALTKRAIEKDDIAFLDRLASPRSTLPHLRLLGIPERIIRARWKLAR